MAKRFIVNAFGGFALGMVLSIPTFVHADGHSNTHDFKTWKQLSEGTYVFGSAGAAFIDQKLSSRIPRSGTISFNTNDKDETSFVTSVGIGLHMHRYFAFEVGYSYMTGAEYKGTITASNANMANHIIDGSPSYTEDIYGHMLTMGIAGTSFDLNDGIGLGLRAGAVFFDITDEMKLSGSGTLNGSAINGSNNAIKITDSGMSWTAGATVFIVPSINERFELRANYMNGLELDNFNKLNVTTAELSYRYRF